MFTVVPLESVDIPVKVSIPGGARGTFTLTIKHLGFKAAGEYLDGSIKTDREVLDDLILEWDGLVDDTGKPISYDDPAAREAIWDNPYIFGPARDAVFTELTGGNYAAAELEKN